MYTPTFPYTGPQVIITSDRVLLHSRKDFIFLFGKKGVSVSTPSTFTVDANEKVAFATPIIELGLRASTDGEQVLLGNSTVTQLGYLLDAIQALSDALTKMSAEELETAIPGIIQTSTVLSGTAKTVKKELVNYCLSNTTYTL